MATSRSFSTPVTAEIDCQRIEDIAEDARVAEHFDTQLFKRHIDISLAKPRPAPVLQRALFTDAVSLS